MKLSFYLLMMILCSNLSAYATSSYCHRLLSEALRSKGENISIVWGKKYREHEISGRALTVNDFDSLADGAYIYLITNNGNVLFERRFFHDLKTDNILATHGSLYRSLEKKNKSFEITSAGEFYIRAGTVSEFNNKSGKFRGDVNSLKIAHEIFEEHGFSISKESLRNYAKKDEIMKSHASEEEMVRVYEKIFSNDELKNQYRTLDNQYQELHSHFPGSRPGSIDEKGIFRKLLKVYENDPDEAMEIYAKVLFFITYRYKDHGGLLFAFNNFLKQESVDSLIDWNNTLLKK